MGPCRCLADASGPSGTCRNLAQFSAGLGPNFDRGCYAAIEPEAPAPSVCWRMPADRLQFSSLVAGDRSVVEVRLRTAILRPAGNVVASRDRTLLAVGNGPQPGLVHTLRGEDGGFGDAGPRIQALETQIQALTNQMEQMAQQLSAMQAQLSGAPQSLPPLPQNGDGPGRQGQAPAQSPTALASATDANAPTSFDTTTTPNGEGQPPANRDADAWPESLSPLPSDVGSGGPGHDQPHSLTAALPANDAKALYEQGYGSVMQRDYAAAEPVFREFLASYPSDPLAGNAQYWLGESYFMRGQFKDAADAFLKGYQTYKSNQMAPDTLLKLGMSLAALGQKDAACSTFTELKTKYPSAGDHIRELAASERTKAGC